MVYWWIGNHWKRCRNRPAKLVLSCQKAWHWNNHWKVSSEGIGFERNYYARFSSDKKIIWINLQKNKTFCLGKQAIMLNIYTSKPKISFSITRFFGWIIILQNTIWFSRNIPSCWIWIESQEIRWIIDKSLESSTNVISKDPQINRQYVFG